MKATKTTTPLRDRCLSHCTTLGIPLEGVSLDELLSRVEKETTKDSHSPDTYIRSPEAYDKGPAAATSALNHVTLVFGPSDRQAAELDRLLSGQQDPTSPNYHHWLTPEAYAERFGASTADVNQMVAWLQSQQLTVTGVTRARNAITVSGSEAGRRRLSYGNPRL
jgi:hypothetical protein